MAFFLIVIGLTGSLIVFYPELDGLLNPLPKVATRDRPLLGASTLREHALAAVPHGMVNNLNFEVKAKEAYLVSFEPRLDPASGKPYDLGLSVIYLDPYSGAEISRRQYSDDVWPITRQNFMPVINRLHYQMALPGSIGSYLFGIVALVWTLDCFVSGYLTFPVSIRRRKEGDAAPAKVMRKHWLARWWKPSWLVKWNGSALRINFDLHRAGGLWFWVMLLAFAWSSVGFNLYEEVYRPVMKAVFNMPDPIAHFPKLATPRPEPGIGIEEAHTLARRMMAEQAAKNGFTIQHEASLSYLSDLGAYMYFVRSDRDQTDHGAATYIVFDAFNGRFGAINIPTGANAGSTIDSWIFALHMAQIWGLPFRIFVAAMGLLIIMLSITGTYIWWKKRRARNSRSTRMNKAAAVAIGT